MGTALDALAVCLQQKQSKEKHQAVSTIRSNVKNERRSRVCHVEDVVVVV